MFAVSILIFAAIGWFGSNNLVIGIVLISVYTVYLVIIYNKDQTRIKKKEQLMHLLQNKRLYTDEHDRADRLSKHNELQTFRNPAQRIDIDREAVDLQLLQDADRLDEVSSLMSVESVARG